MAGSSNVLEFRKRMARLETLIQEAERLQDPRAQGLARELAQSVLDLHGAALERLLEQVVAVGESGMALIHALARDDLVGSLLLLHGLHPLDTETRVRQALDDVRPYLRSHGGNVELLGISGSVVRLRMLGSCDGCPSSAETLRGAIEEAVCARAPEVTAIDLDALVPEAALHRNGSARMALPILSG